MTVQPTDTFATSLSAAMSTLTLGRALSAAQRATLSRRTDKGFRLATLVAGEHEVPPPIVEADSDGRIGNEFADDQLANIAALHAAVLAARPGAGGAILIRSPRLAAWGLSGRPLPVRYFQMFGYTRAQEIPVAAPRPSHVRETLAAHPDTPALLFRDGRTLIWAPSSDRAVRLVLSLEEAAPVTAIAERLGGAKDYPADARDKIYQSLQAQARR